MPKIASKNKKTDRELCQIIATSITDIVRGSLNSAFRQTYFNIVQVTNSSDAQHLLENRLLDLLGIDKLSEKNYTINDEISLENYIASKILRSCDAMDTHKNAEMSLLIKHILNIDSAISDETDN